MWSGIARPHQLCMNKGKRMNGLAALTSCINLLYPWVLSAVIVSGSGLINTIMERGGFSGDFLVTFALSSGTSFSAGVCPDVLSSGCVETSVQAPLWNM